MLAGLVFTIMEDVMELSTIEEAQGVFGYLESRIKKLSQVLHPSFRESSPLVHSLCPSMMPYRVALHRTSLSSGWVPAPLWQA